MPHAFDHHSYPAGLQEQGLALAAMRPPNSDNGTDTQESVTQVVEQSNVDETASTKSDNTRTDWVVISLYVGFAILNLVELAMTAGTINALNNNKGGSFYSEPESLYTNFASTSLILSTAVISIVALIYIALWRRSETIRHTTHLPFALEMVVTHFIVLILWLSGSVAEIVWLSQGYYCLSNGECIYLLKSSKVYDGFVAAFAIIITVIWVAPTIMTISTSVDRYRELHPGRRV